VAADLEAALAANGHGLPSLAKSESAHQTVRYQHV